MRTFPISLSGIDKFERKNSISVCVIGTNNKGSYIPMRHTQISNAVKHIDLLLINDGGKMHYLPIEEFNRLVGSQYSNHQHKHHICRTCYLGCSSE